MLRLGKVYDQRWEQILAEARKYSLYSAHPAKLMVTPNKIIYWHHDGLLQGFWHAELNRDSSTSETTLVKNEDERARSEIESYQFLNTLLNITNKRVQGAGNHEQQAPRKSGDR